MTTMTTGSAADFAPTLTRTARATGAWYLGLALTGVLGFLIIRPQIFDPNSATATFGNLMDKPGLAQAGLALELSTVITQAVVAVDAPEARVARAAERQSGDTRERHHTVDAGHAGPHLPGDLDAAALGEDRP